MFGNEIFRTWPAVFLGASCFSLLFGMIVALSDSLFFEAEGITSAAIGITILSFVGYLGIAIQIRNEEPQ
ncbi:MAG: hypothetical protein ACOCTG_00635 [Bacteroidota bacterium]